MLEDYAKRISLRVVSFQTALPWSAVYTNVMMAIGDNFCVICDEVIPEFERRFVVKSLAKDKQVISNISNRSDEPILRAYSTAAGSSEWR